MTKIKIKMNHVIQYIDTPPHLLARGGGNDSLLCEPRDSSDWNSRFNIWCGSLSRLPSGVTHLVRDPLVKGQFVRDPFIRESFVINFLVRGIFCQSYTFIRGSPSSEVFWSEVPIPLLPVSRHVVDFSRILWQKRPLTKRKQWQKSLWRMVLWPKSLWQIVLWHKGLWGKNLWPQPSWYPYGTIHGSI